jgi:hypothetical protein
MTRRHSSSDAPPGRTEPEKRGTSDAATRRDTVNLVTSEECRMPLQELLQQRLGVVGALGHLDEVPVVVDEEDAGGWHGRVIRLVRFSKL